MSDQPTPLDRFLSLFSEVRGGEGVTALLLTLDVFLLLTAYYCLKPVREALILGGPGAEWKSYVSAGQALLLLALVPAYGALADRLPRRRLLDAVTGFFVACLVAFYLLARAGVSVGVAFYLWVGIFNMMIVAQFWSFANDLYSRDQGERLFPIVAFGGSLGAVVGSAAAGWLIPIVGVTQLLPAAIVPLALAAAVANLVDRRERDRCEAGLPPRFTTAEIPAATGEYLVQGPGAGAGERVTVSLSGTGPRPGTFRLVLEDHYLLIIALLVLMLNWVNSTGEYILGHTVQTAALKAAAAAGITGDDPVKEFVGQFAGQYYAGFFTAVNLAGLLLQLFVVSRVLRYFGLRTAVLVLPCIALFGYSLLAFMPVLAVVRLVKMAENATDYSLQNTVRGVLFLPTSRDQKYKAKQVIDSFFVRAGDVLSALLIFVGVHGLGLGTPGFARVNLVLVAVWLVLAVLVGRAYAGKSATT